MPSTSATAKTAALINGSFVSTPADWMLPGDADQIYEAIQGWYGYSPSTAAWVSNIQVWPPNYPDIVGSAQQMANTLAAFPPGDLNVITHSHGGNVAILASLTPGWATPIRRLVNLGTPINWDLPGYLGGPGAAGRCQISSTADWVQFIGASPTQIVNFAYAIYASIAGAVAAFEAAAFGDYLTALAYFQYAVFEVIQAEQWWLSTKVEVTGPTYMFSGLSHSDLHTAPVWNAIAPYCG